MTIVVLIYEKNKTKHENFAYINIHLGDIQTQTKIDPRTGEQIEFYELLTYEADVISRNKVIGKFQSVFNYSIENRQDQVMLQ